MANCFSKPNCKLKELISGVSIKLKKLEFNQKNNVTLNSKRCTQIVDVELLKIESK